MSTRVSLRRNGRHMITIQVRYDLDVNDLIDRVAHQICIYGDDVPTSKAAFLKMARADCTQHGTQELDHSDFDDWPELRADIASYVRLVFPELAGEIEPHS